MEELCREVIKKAEMIDKIARSYNMTNEQWFLDFQDKLNEISVR